MTGELNEHQINNLLLSQVVGRIACCSKEQPYIVPVTYAFDGIYIYGQTNEGKKLDILRNNRNVCFEADAMINMQNWQSVIVYGSFEELKGKELEKAREIFHNRIFPLMTSSTVHKHEHATSSVVDDSTRVKYVMYRIKIKSKTGRFERQ